MGIIPTSSSAKRWTRWRSSWNPNSLSERFSGNGKFGTGQKGLNLLGKVADPNGFEPSTSAFGGLPITWFYCPTTCCFLAFCRHLYVPLFREFWAKKNPGDVNRLGEPNSFFRNTVVLQRFIARIGEPASPSSQGPVQALLLGPKGAPQYSASDTQSDSRGAAAQS